jgi:hypothetical protein
MAMGSLASPSCSDAIRDILLEDRPVVEANSTAVITDAS